ncbi:hypothetical protein Nos7107_4748 [Nostoc sp. PCC 7107]|nr:hypothetical protein Nos7107_4748 [Nostoc sp. PCC 7107]
MAILNAHVQTMLIPNYDNWRTFLVSIIQVLIDSDYSHTTEF